VEKRTDEKLYRMKEACAILGVHPNTIRLWEKRGKIRIVRSQGGHRRIPKSEIERLLGTKSTAFSPPKAEKSADFPAFLTYVFSYHPDDWELVRKAILIRDNYACRRCGSGESVDVYRKEEAGPNSPENLITLCRRCRGIERGPEKVRREQKVRPKPTPKKPSPPKELPRHEILDNLKPEGLAQRAAFGDLLSAAVVLENFTPEDLAFRARCPENLAKLFCERMRANNYVISKNGSFKLNVRLIR